MKKKILITGSNGTLGSHLVKLFSKNLWDVYGIDIHKKSKNLLSNNYLSYDFTSFNEVFSDEIQFFLKNSFKNGLDCVINNSALQITSKFENISYCDLFDSLKVNFIVPVMLTQSLLKPLLKKNGHVINITSIHTRLTKQYFLPYSTSKSALENFTKSLVLEYGSILKVNNIAPAAFVSEMLKRGFKNKNFKNSLSGCHPSHSLGDPEKISSLIFFIINNNDSFLNGSTIDVSGGISSKLHELS